MVSETRLDHGDLPPLTRAQAHAILEPIVRSLIIDATGIQKVKDRWVMVNDLGQLETIDHGQLLRIVEDIEFVTDLNGHHHRPAYYADIMPEGYEGTPGFKELVSMWIDALHQCFWGYFDNIIYPSPKRTYLQLGWNDINTLRTREMDFRYLLDWVGEEVPDSRWLIGYDKGEENRILDKVIDAIDESISNHEFNWTEKTDAFYHADIVKGVYVRLKVYKHDEDVEGKDITVYLNDDIPVAVLNTDYHRYHSPTREYPSRYHVAVTTLMNLYLLKKANRDKDYRIDWSAVRFGYDGLNHPDIAYPGWQGESVQVFNFEQLCDLTKMFMKS